MSNLARAIDAGAIHHRAGEVVAVTGGTLRVKAASGSFDARRAASCLREPQRGDLVELALVEGGDVYVVAVLEASAGAATRIAIEGDLELAPRGRLTLSSPERVELLSEGDLNVVAGKVAVRTVEVKATFERVVALGKSLHQQIEKVRSVSSTVDLVAERLTQTVDRCYRMVAEAETVRAARIDMRATELLRLHAASSVVTADQLVKVDAGQIHMG